MVSSWCDTHRGWAWLVGSWTDVKEWEFPSSQTPLNLHFVTLKISLGQISRYQTVIERGMCMEVQTFVLGLPNSLGLLGTSKRTD